MTKTLEWPAVPSRRPQAVALLLGALLTVAMLTPFWRPWGARLQSSRPESGGRRDGTLLYLLSVPAVVQKNLVSSGSSAAPVDLALVHRHAASPERPAPLAAPLPAPRAIGESNWVGAPAPQQSPSAPHPASEPLRLDAEVMHQAIAGSKSDFRRQADAAGTYAGDAAASPAQRVNQALGKAGKPSCVRPGDSLISGVIAAYEVLTDNCRP